MMSDNDGLSLPDFDEERVAPGLPMAAGRTMDDEDHETKDASDLATVADVPVNVSAVLGRTHMNVASLMRLGPGTVLELDRKVGEAIDIYVNNRLVARGEIVIVEERLGVTMTEIIKDNGAG